MTHLTIVLLLLTLNLPLATVFSPQYPALRHSSNLQPSPQRRHCRPLLGPGLTRIRTPTIVDMDDGETAYLGLEAGGRAELFPREVDDALRQVRE